MFVMQIRRAREDVGEEQDGRREEGEGQREGRRMRAAREERGDEVGGGRDGEGEGRRKRRRRQGRAKREPGVRGCAWKICGAGKGSR